MKYAVIATGGKQYLVAPGDTITIEKLPETTVGAAVTFNDVLLTDDGAKTTLGSPNVAGLTVTGEVVSEGRHDKVLVVKYKAKNRNTKRNGHRQPYSEVKITKIG